MRIFHGSESIIKKPRFGFGNPRNDYGLGLYCTESKELAKEWACQKNHDGFANCYELAENDLSTLDLSEKKYSILHWLTVLMQNRIFTPKTPLGRQNLKFLQEKFYIDYNNYDIITGYRADDSYFSFASDFLENAIPLQALASSMKLGNLGLQVVLKSKKAFEAINFICYEKADCSKYFFQYTKRDGNARQDYFDKLRNLNLSDAIYLIDIVRNQEILNDLSI